MLEVLRKEKKFLLPTYQACRVENRIENLLAPDYHNQTGGYCVRSLYFDTWDNRDYYAKEDGLDVRRKIRLRIYSPDAAQVKLEMKQKQGDNQRKRSLMLSRADAERLCQGDYTALLTYGNLGLEFYSLMSMLGYQPKVIIEYNRMAYVAKENRIRIAFDRNVRSSLYPRDFFAQPLLCNPVLEPDCVILEVKYQGFLLSYIKDILNSVNASETSVSKYCLGRMVL